jgi:hypothetical protein
MERKPLVIDIAALEAAFGNNSPEFRAYLDTQEGEVATLQGPAVADVAALQRFAAEPGRWLLIEPVAPRVQHGWMTRFIETVKSEALRAALTASIDGVGAFRQFKQVLRAEPRERERWFTFRSGLLRVQIEAWLQEHEVVVQGSSLAAALRSLATEGEAAREANLRRVGAEYIDRLPEASLRLALVYLRYLAPELAPELAGPE